MALDIMEGLSGPQKTLPSKYFYDTRGSELFEEICLQPEYYVTRTELEILARYAHKIMENFGGGDLVELGSGANWKIKRLLDAIDPAARSSIRYVPVDVSDSALQSASRELMLLFPEITVKGVVADFTSDLYELPQVSHKMILFLGGTIGNLDQSESNMFLGAVSGAMGKDDRFILGADMVKPREALERAYNDEKGVTADFNKNILHVINRELGADFDPDLFEHVAYFNEPQSRVEMRLRSLERQEVRIESIDLRVHFSKGETILTEICRKFTREGLVEMADKAGLKTLGFFTDPKEYFCLVELTKA
jgi:L-histidine N-alpha-methyltransferase